MCVARKEAKESRCEDIGQLTLHYMLSTHGIVICHFVLAESSLSDRYFCRFVQFKVVCD